MTDNSSTITRRTALVGLGSGVLTAGLSVARPGIAQIGAKRTFVLRAHDGGPEVRRASLSVGPDAPPLRRGDEVMLRFENLLEQPSILTFRGLDGEPAAEPLVARQPVAPGGSDSFALKLRGAGTLLADLTLIDDGRARMPAVPLVVAEAQPPQIDGDQIILIEDTRLGADGRPLAPGSDASDAPWLFTVNGKPSAEIAVHTYGRFRLRFINACQRNVIAIKINDHDVRVMALDSQPAEPFPARNGALVIPPGGRIDAFVDAVRPPASRSAITLHDGSKPTPIGNLVYSSEPPLRAAALPLPPPLPNSGLPAQLSFESALRVEVPIGALVASQMGWFAPDKFVPAAGPAFQIKRGRTAVLALVNRATSPMVFRLHGHHFRLLDRLDDGWKPFWLDTLAVDAGQTQRIAFAAEHSGLWLMEAFAAKWSAPLLLRSYRVN
jgi:FtsP/CotA-like multicopper oxidase with cupredoxin domain